MTDEQIEEKARIYAGLKEGFDEEEEWYYNQHKMQLYEAYIEGFNDSIKEYQRMLKA